MSGERIRLPDRRAAEIVVFAHDNRVWTASFGRDESGNLAEVFIDAEKESPLADAAREVALVCSLALQHGCPLETLRHALDGRDAGPLAAPLDAIGG
jgi:hypothetical protein